MMSNIFKKYREQLLYILFGLLTTAVSIAVYALFTEAVPLDALAANIISWLAAVLFAFLTNRKWVFKGSCGSPLKQLLSFYSGRLLTLAFEELLLWIFINRLGFGSMAVKCAAQAAVIILNYIISKFLVFKKEN